MNCVQGRDEAQALDFATKDAWDVILWLFKEMHEQLVGVAEFTPLFQPEMVWEQTFLLELRNIYIIFPL